MHIVKRPFIDGLELKNVLVRCFNHCHDSRPQWAARLLHGIFGTGAVTIIGHLGIADGVSTARVWARRYSK